MDKCDRSAVDTSLMQDRRLVALFGGVCCRSLHYLGVSILWILTRGLPLSRLYARYLGGALDLVPLPGYGTWAVSTDVFLCCFYATNFHPDTKLHRNSVKLPSVLTTVDHVSIHPLNFPLICRFILDFSPDPHRPRHRNTCLCQLGSSSVAAGGSGPRVWAFMTAVVNGGLQTKGCRG